MAFYYKVALLTGRDITVMLNCIYDIIFCRPQRIVPEFSQVYVLKLKELKIRKESRNTNR